MLALNVSTQTMTQNEAWICGARLQSVEHTPKWDLSVQLLIMDYAD